MKMINKIVIQMIAFIVPVNITNESDKANCMTFLFFKIFITCINHVTDSESYVTAGS